MVTSAYGKMLYNMIPYLENLCQIEEFTSICGGPPYRYYRLDKKEKTDPLYADCEIADCEHEISVRGFTLIPGAYHRSYKNTLIRVYKGHSGSDVNIYVHDKLLIKAFPSILSSIKYLKQQMSSTGDDLAFMWGELRQTMLSSEA